MLRHLRIQNFALVEKLTVEFSPGLNIITGETGAGKSVLIGACGLLLGERADKSAIRAGEDRCTVEAAFELDAPEAVNTLLEERGLPSCEDGVLVLRRVIKAEGAGQNLVNDAPVTLQVLKDLGDELVDMHGPHDHQSLLHTDAQLDILDAFGHHHAEREAVAEAYRSYRDLEARIAELTVDEGTVAEQLDLHRFRVKEIGEAELREDEEETIRQEHGVVGNAQRILELAQGVTEAMTEGDPSAFGMLVQARPAMDELAGLMPEAESWAAEYDEVMTRLRDLSTDLQSEAADVEADPARLDWLDQRLAAYERLKRKYGPTVSDVLEVLADSEARVQELENLDEQVRELEKEKAQTEKALAKRCRVLHEERVDAAGDLARVVTDELRALGFPNGAFTIDLRETAPGRKGADEVEFGFAPNLGEPGRPLRAIASSGEISRVMLACKAVLARHDRVPVLVFDEIDANVGGEIGGAVGAKLAGVASHHQVLCITHLPQVAVHGTVHYAVGKSVAEGRTRTSVRRLAEDERAEEIARMLGGADMSDVTLEHARQMLARSAE